MLSDERLSELSRWCIKKLKSVEDNNPRALPGRQWQLDKERKPWRDLADALGELEDIRRFKRERAILDERD